LVVLYEAYHDAWSLEHKVSSVTSMLFKIQIRHNKTPSY